MTPESLGQEALRNAAETFASLVTAKVKVFRELCAEKENTEVTGDFVEEMLRGYINSWLAPMGIYPGSLVSPRHKRKLKQIDGLIWQPSFGPPVLREGNTLLLHPNTVRAIVELKTSVESVRHLHDRLSDLWEELKPTEHSARDAMGIILFHNGNPETASNPHWRTVDGNREPLHTRAVNAHPIYILFERRGQFDYEPYFPAIMELIFRLNNIANTPRVNTLL